MVMIVVMDGTDGNCNDGGCYANNDYHEWLELSYQENKSCLKALTWMHSNLCVWTCVVLCAGFLFLKQPWNVHLVIPFWLYDE